MRFLTDTPDGSSIRAREYIGLRVYIAGPINGSGDRAANCAFAEDVAAALHRAGFVPYVAHANNPWMRRHGYTEAEALELDFAWLDRCDVLVRLPGISPGSDMEVQRAKAMHMVVVDFHDPCDVRAHPVTRLERVLGRVVGPLLDTRP